MKNLKKNYEKAVNDYCEKFAEIYEIDFDGWVAGVHGEVATFGDFFFNLSEIIFCIENKINLNWLLNWYDFNLEYHKKSTYNFKTYCKLRFDFERKTGFNFTLNDFEKHLLYLRIKN